VANPCTKSPDNFSIARFRVTPANVVSVNVDRSHVRLFRAGNQCQFRVFNLAEPGRLSPRCRTLYDDHQSRCTNRTDSRPERERCVRFRPRSIADVGQLRARSGLAMPTARTVDHTGSGASSQSEPPSAFNTPRYHQAQASIKPQWMAVTRPLAMLGAFVSLARPSAQSDTDHVDSLTTL